MILIDVSTTYFEIFKLLQFHLTLANSFPDTTGFYGLLRLKIFYLQFR